MNKILTFSRHPKVLQVLVLLFVVGLLTSLSLGIIPINNSYNKADKNSLCILSEGECELSLTEGTMTVSIAGQLLTEEQLDIAVTLPDNLTITSARIEGINMYMGVIPVVLKQQGKNKWAGWFMLGSCREPQMQWQLLIQLNGYAAPVSVRFTTTQ